MKVETLLLSGLPVAGGRAAARSLCMHAVGGGLSSLAVQISDESALARTDGQMNSNVYLSILWKGSMMNYFTQQEEQ